MRPRAYLLAYSLTLVSSHAADFDVAKRAFTAGQYRSAVDELVALAQLPDSPTVRSAQVLLAHMYAFGEGVQQSHQTAIGLLQRAGTAGDPSAKLLLANHHYKPYSSAPPKEVVALYEQAIAQGFLPAYSQLASLLLLSKTDTEKTLKYLRSAASQGDGMALYTLGSIYVDPGNVFRTGIVTDAQQAISYWTGASEAGEAVASVALARHFGEGGLGIPKNSSIAAKYLEVAAQQILADDQSHPLFDREQYPRSHSLAAEAALRLGNLYRSGKAVKHNYVEAARWYTFAAKYSNLGKMYLGQAYYYGEGVSRDLRVAFDLIMPAAANGDHQAEHYIAYMLGRGLGVNRNETEALTWYQRAVKVAIPLQSTNLLNCCFHRVRAATRIHARLVCSNHPLVRAILMPRLRLGLSICGENWYQRIRAKLLPC